MLCMKRIQWCIFTLVPSSRSPLYFIQFSSRLIGLRSMERNSSNASDALGIEPRIIPLGVFVLYKKKNHRQCAILLAEYLLFVPMANSAWHLFLCLRIIYIRIRILDRCYLNFVTKLSPFKGFILQIKVYLSILLIFNFTNIVY